MPSRVLKVTHRQSPKMSMYIAPSSPRALTMIRTRDVRCRMPSGHCQRWFDTLVDVGERAPALEGGTEGKPTTSAGSTLSFSYLSAATCVAARTAPFTFGCG